jgi:lysozyme family protein
MNFDRAIEHILSFEGGYSLDPHDPGGETNFGISKRAYPDADIKNLTRVQAIAIYQRDYWDSLKMLLMPERLRLCLFDCAVNQGRDKAIKILQAAVGVEADGVIGPQTLNAARAYNAVDALHNMVLARLAHYSKLNTWPRYGVGWTKRLLSVTIASLR